MKKKLLVFSLWITALILLLLAFGFQTKLEINSYSYINSNLPEAFDSYRIVQLSDFHGATFGTDEEELIQAVASCEPNLIVLTGDMIDRDHPSFDSLLSLLTGITKIAPVYAISGNHEFDSWTEFQKLLAVYDYYGVHFIDDANVLITQEGEHIFLQGMKFADISSAAQVPPAPEDSFSILLNHASNAFEYTGDAGYDIVFSGHTHGGIIRLPLVGGLIGTCGDRILPKYDAGVFTKNNSTLYSSRGLGDAAIPRFNNNPEVICVELKKS